MVMTLEEYPTRAVEVVKTRRSGFLQRGWFIRYRDAVEYMANDLVINKEQKAMYVLKAKGFGTGGELYINYQDYRKGKEYGDFFRLLNDRVTRWVKMEEDFLRFDKKIKKE